MNKYVYKYNGTAFTLFLTFITHHLESHPQAKYLECIFCWFVFPFFFYFLVYCVDSTYYLQYSIYHSIIMLMFCFLQYFRYIRSSCNKRKINQCCCVFHICWLNHSFAFGIITILIRKKGKRNMKQEQYCYFLSWDWKIPTKYFCRSLFKLRLSRKKKKQNI